LSPSRKKQRHPRAYFSSAPRVSRVSRQRFTFISIGNDLHHVLTQAGEYVNNVEGIAKQREILDAPHDCIVLNSIPAPKNEGQLAGHRAPFLLSD